MCSILEESSNIVARTLVGLPLPIQALPRISQETHQLIFDLPGSVPTSECVPREAQSLSPMSGSSCTAHKRCVFFDLFLMSEPVSPHLWSLSSTSSCCKRQGAKWNTPRQFREHSQTDFFPSVFTIPEAEFSSCPYTRSWYNGAQGYSSCEPGGSNWSCNPSLERDSFSEALSFSLLRCK